MAHWYETEQTNKQYTSYSTVNPGFESDEPVENDDQQANDEDTGEN